MHHVPARTGEEKQVDLTSDAHTEYNERTFKRLACDGEEIVAKQFYDCTFIDCTFVETVFKKCRFVHCTFKTCDLSLAQVPDTAFSDTMFEQSKAIGINWTRAAWGRQGNWLQPIRFVECVINYSTFIGMDLRSITIKQCVAKDVEFSDTNLTQADFRHTDLSASRFVQTNLTEADFTGARGYAIVATLNKLKKTKFSLPEALSLLYGLDIVLSDDDQLLLQTQLAADSTQPD
jgi:fluoroquinolone resistance protein